MPFDDFAEHRPEVRGQPQVAAFIQLMVAEPRPFAVHFSALHRPAHHKHAVGVTVVGAAIPVFVRGAPEFRHGDEHDVLHAVAHVSMERRQTLSQIAQEVRKLALRAALVDVVVPAAAIHEHHFHADIGLEELSDLLQALAQTALGIFRAVFRLELRGIGLAQHINRFEGFGSGAAQRLVHRLRVKGLEPAFNNRRLRDHLKLSYVRQSDSRRRPAQHPRQTRAHGHGAERRSIRLGQVLQRAVQPAIFGGLHSRRARLHEILRVEVRPRRVRRARRVHDGELLLVKQRLERRETRM